jgi:putative ABC transport system permease protein
VTPIWTLARPWGDSSYSYGTVPWPSPAANPWTTSYATLLPAPGVCANDPGVPGIAPTLCIPAGDRLRRPELKLGVAVGDDRTVRAEAGQDLPEASRALAAGRAAVTDPLLLWPDGTVRLRLWTTPDGAPGTLPTTNEREFSFPAVVVDSPVLFEAVLPTDAVRRAVPDADALLHSSSAITDGRPPRFPPRSSDDLRNRLGVIAPSSTPSDLGYGTMVRDLAVLAFAALVTVFGAASAVALAAAEGRADAATLAAVGAAPATRRRLAAMQALTIAGLGGVAGVASGLLAGWGLIRTISGERVDVASPGVQVVHGGVSYGGYAANPGGDFWAGFQASVPWVHVITLGVGLPLVLSAAAYLLTRSRLPMVRRST